MQRNKYRSYNKGSLPKGCQYCVKGEKLVIFITGKCPRSCYFCPVSDQKYQNDVQFANERPVKDFNDIIEEAREMDALGAGITGGDPLEKLERTCEYNCSVINCIQIIPVSSGRLRGPHKLLPHALSQQGGLQDPGKSYSRNKAHLF